MHQKIANLLRQVMTPTARLGLFALLFTLPVAAQAGGLSLDQMIINLSGFVDDYERMVVGFCYIMGFSFMFKALYHLKVYGEARTMMSTQTSLKTPITYIVVGLVFTYLPTAVYSLLETTYGNTNILAYSEWQGAARFGSDLVYAVFRIVQFIGLVAFVRGFFLLAQGAGQGAQQGTFGKAVTHIFGGVLGMNIIATTNMLSNSLGITFFQT